jgi:hypothetical protein
MRVIAKAKPGAIQKGNDNVRHCEGEAWRHPEGK